VALEQPIMKQIFGTARHTRSSQAKTGSPGRTMKVKASRMSVRNSLLVTKQSSADILTNILINNLINLESQYAYNFAYTLVVQGNWWQWIRQ
jgi:hypothetical protein